MPRVRLPTLDGRVADRCAQTARHRPSWPCRAGCADCCRSLSREPELAAAEWECVRQALRAPSAEDRAQVDAAADERRRRLLDCLVVEDA